MIKHRLRVFLFAAWLVLTLPALALASANGLVLTDEERAWLAENPSVIFSGDPNWLPYEAFDNQGNYIGIVSEHLDLIAEMTGLQFVMSPSETWTESTEKAKRGEIDVLSETDDSDLKSHLDFTTAYISNPIVIVMRSGENFSGKINDIRQRDIALIRDYGYAAKIRRAYPDIAFTTVDDIQDGLVSVSTGEVDALLCTLALCSYTIAEMGLNNVSINGKTEFDTKLAFGVQKNLPELRGILNKAIERITAEHQQHILDRWITGKFAERVDYTLITQIVGIAVVVLGIFVIWTHRLSVEVSLRIDTEAELKRAQEVLRLSNQRLLSHRQHTPLGVIEWNTDFEVLDWNEAAEKIFGFTREEMVGRHAAERILLPDTRDAVDKVWQKLINDTGGKRSCNENMTKDGRRILCEWYNTPLFDQEGKVVGVASLVDDVTERKLSEEMVWKQANYDVLTGLPNRNMFHDRLRQDMLKADRDHCSLALLLIDLDQFKEVNDTLGHDAGDELLQHTANRILECVRHSDTVARLGGDEFTVILPELHDSAHVEDVAQKVIDRIEEAFHLGEEIVHVSASIGLTLYPADANDIETLVKNADQAMYAAKRKGRNCYSYFTQSLQDAAQARRKLMIELRNALDNEQFEVYYQPVMDLKSGRIAKAEALLRWHHPEHGLISPLDFISLAEESGLIYKIGDWVVRQSMAQARGLRERHSDDFQISINLSPLQFKVDNRKFFNEWSEYLSQSGLSGSNIVIEITESSLLHAEDDVIAKLLWLRDTGIQVAIDDFGTGYSSLSYLRKFDIDYLKIDKSFISNLSRDYNDITLCDAIILMAHTLGLKVIAEGVESTEQQAFLAAADCDYAQGYLFSKPVPASELARLMQCEVS